jgi:hypothetical protein
MTQTSISGGISSLQQVCPLAFLSRRPKLTFVDSETRRQAATDFTRALMENFESEVTGIIQGYITQYLQVSLRLLTCIRKQEAPKLTSAGLRFQPGRQMEVERHRHLPSHLYRFKRINTAG